MRDVPYLAKRRYVFDEDEEYDEVILRDVSYLAKRRYAFDEDEEYDEVILRVVSYLAKRRYAFDEDEEYDEPGQQETEGQPPTDATHVLQSVRHIQNLVTGNIIRKCRTWVK